jgi:pSer/pThr/pTyr-binding forkhead associated (FHA) protein
MECRLVRVSSEEMYLLREGETTVGRDSDNDIQVLDPDVSRHHACFANLSSVCEVEDLNSANGTFVNGDKITAMALKHGNEIRFGAEVFRFEEIASVGADEVTVPQRDYSDRAQKGTVKIKQAPQIEKKEKPVMNFKPLRPKS